MSLTVETVAFMLQDKTALDLHTVLCLRCTCKPFCTTITGHFPDLELRVDPSNGRLLVGVDSPSSQVLRRSSASKTRSLRGAQAPHVVRVKQLWGPRLSHVVAEEAYIPLLHLFTGLKHVEICDNLDKCRHCINLLGLAALPALRTLHVGAWDFAGLKRVRHLEQLTQLDSLKLADILPDRPALPAGLTCLELVCVDGLDGARGNNLRCPPVLSQLAGNLQKLDLGQYVEQFDSDPGQLAALACLQNLTHLALCFFHCSPETCHFQFPNLLQLSVQMGHVDRPYWNFSGCSGLQHFKLCILGTNGNAIDLSQVVSLCTESLTLQLLGDLNCDMVILDGATWRVRSISLSTWPEPGVTSPRRWQDCGIVVQGVLCTLLGVVPFNKFWADGVLALWCAHVDCHNVQLKMRPQQGQVLIRMLAQQIWVWAV